MNTDRQLETVKKILDGLGFFRVTSVTRENEETQSVRITGTLMKVSAHPQLSSQQYCFGEYTYNPDIRSLRWKEKKRQLSQKEAELLSLLLDNSGSVVKRDYILKTYWGDNNFFTSRSLDVFVTKLRNYLKFDPSIRIINLRKNGLLIIY